MKRNATKKASAYPHNGRENNDVDCGELQGELAHTPEQKMSYHKTEQRQENKECGIQEAVTTTTKP